MRKETKEMLTKISTPKQLLTAMTAVRNLNKENEKIKDPSNYILISSYGFNDGSQIAQLIIKDQENKQLKHCVIDKESNIIVGPLDSIATNLSSTGFDCDQVDGHLRFINEQTAIYVDLLGNVTDAPTQKGKDFHCFMAGKTPWNKVKSAYFGDPLFVKGMIDVTKSKYSNSILECKDYGEKQGLRIDCECEIDEIKRKSNLISHQSTDEEILDEIENY